MKDTYIMLSTIGEVKDFARIVAQYDVDIDLVSGRHVVDAKSIMGIFSLDLSKPMKIEIRSDEPGTILTAIQKFITE